VYRMCVCGQTNVKATRKCLASGQQVFQINNDNQMPHTLPQFLPPCPLATPNDICVAFSEFLKKRKNKNIYDNVTFVSHVNWFRNQAMAMANLTENIVPSSYSLFIYMLSASL